MSCQCTIRGIFRSRQNQIKRRELLMTLWHFQPNNIPPCSVIMTLARILASASSSFVWTADVIQLKNGARFPGAFFRWKIRVLTVDADYTDIIKIDRDDVNGPTSDKPLWVSFHKGRSFWMSSVSGGDRLILFRLKPVAPVPLNRIKTINLFDLSYRGTVSLGGSVTCKWKIKVGPRSSLNWQPKFR